MIKYVIRVSVGLHNLATSCIKLYVLCTSMNSTLNTSSLGFRSSSAVGGDGLCNGRASPWQMFMLLYQTFLGTGWARHPCLEAVVDRRLSVGVVVHVSIFPFLPRITFHFFGSCFCFSCAVLLGDVARLLSGTRVIFNPVCVSCNNL